MISSLVKHPLRAAPRNHVTVLIEGQSYRPLVSKRSRGGGLLNSGICRPLLVYYLAHDFCFVL